MKDYYKILGISSNASEDEIKKAYKKKAKSCHPDLFPNDKEKEEEFKLINEAQEALLNKPKETLIPIPGIPKMFVNTELTLKDLYNDSEIEVIYYIGKDKCSYCNGSGKVRKQETSPFGFFIVDSSCPYCNGTGRVGEQIRKTYKTTAKKLFFNNCNFKDDNVEIYLSVTLKPDSKWKLDFNGDLIITLDIDIPLAVLGGEKEITLLDDSKIKIKIPKGTQNYAKLKVKRKGIVPDRNLIINIIVKIPTELTEKEEQLYKELQNG